MVLYLFLLYIRVYYAYNELDNAEKKEKEDFVMKLYKIKNIDRFFDAVNRCEGKVELVTDTGIYNLKSTLSQIINVQ